MIGEVMDTATAAIAAAGLDVYTDPRDVNAPCCLVTVPVVEPALANGAGSASVTVYVIAPDIGYRNAANVLDGMLTTLDAAGLLSDRLESDAVLVPGAPDGLPAYRYALELTYEPTKG